MIFDKKMTEVEGAMTRSKTQRRIIQEGMGEGRAWNASQQPYLK